MIKTATNRITITWTQILFQVEKSYICDFATASLYLGESKISDEKHSK
jgi:hypothetical protein